MVWTRTRRIVATELLVILAALIPAALLYRAVGTGDNVYALVGAICYGGIQICRLFWALWLDMPHPDVVELRRLRHPR